MAPKQWGWWVWCGVCVLALAGTVGTRCWCLERLEACLWFLPGTFVFMCWQDLEAMSFLLRVNAPKQCCSECVPEFPALGLLGM